MWAHPHAVLQNVFRVSENLIYSPVWYHMRILAFSRHDLQMYIGCISLRFLFGWNFDSFIDHSQICMCSHTLHTYIYLPWTGEFWFVYQPFTHMYAFSHPTHTCILTPYTHTYICHELGNFFFGFVYQLFTHMYVFSNPTHTFICHWLENFDSFINHSHIHVFSHPTHIHIFAIDKVLCAAICIVGCVRLGCDNGGGGGIFG